MDFEKILKDRDIHYWSKLRQTYIENKNICPPCPVLPLSKKRTLDCQGVLDDFYANILDWEGSMVVVGLLENLGFYNYEAETSKYYTMPSDGIINSVRWLTCNYVVFGFTDGNDQNKLSIWNVQKEKPGRELNHPQICDIAKIDVDNTILCATENGMIFHHDLRIKNTKTSEFKAHLNKICKIKIKNDHVFASGGNDDLLKIWDIRNTKTSKLCLQHSAGVRGFEFSDDNKIVSGGGTKDPNIRTWSLFTGCMLNEYKIESQITNIFYLKNSKEFVVTTGYTKNEIIVFNEKFKKRAYNANSHQARLLYASVGMEDTILCTTGPDNEIHFWDLGIKNKKESWQENHEKENLIKTNIR